MYKTKLKKDKGYMLIDGLREGSAGFYSNEAEAVEAAERIFEANSMRDSSVFIVSATRISTDRT